MGVIIIVFAAMFLYIINIKRKSKVDHWASEVGLTSIPNNLLGSDGWKVCYTWMRPMPSLAE